jgi:hypothetical protein
VQPLCQCLPLGRLVVHLIQFSVYSSSGRRTGESTPVGCCLVEEWFAITVELG